MAAATAYTVLARAMCTRRQAALARLVLSGRRHVALLRPRRAFLLLHLLHYPAQLRSAARLEAELPTPQMGATELRLAGALIDAYRRPLRWSDYVDDSVQSLVALVRAKLDGQTPTESDLQATPLPDLLNTLRQSVAALAVNPSAGNVRSRKQASRPRRPS